MSGYNHREIDPKWQKQWRESDTFLLGLRFSFAEGVKNGKSTVSVIRGTLDWLDRDQQQAIALRTTLSGGIDVLGATINPSGVPDGRFFAWLGQADQPAHLCSPTLK